MWSDNETTTDLLGFDFLVDSLLVLLEEPKLLPLTVGVAGDWGSGKSSLMQMALEALADREDVVCVAFSPWRFEGYEDVKSALMATVLTAVESRIEGEPSLKEKLFERATQLREHLNVMAGLRAVGIGVAAMHGLPPEAAIGASAAAASLLDRSRQEAPDELEVVHTVASFRDEFASLVRDMDGLTAVIVFIDDLDRCLPPAIVDTFEAIRLFLHVPKTAYVIAHHPRIIEAAIERRYPGNREGDERLGLDYLEKILQMTVSVPPLVASEAETFINLLLAESVLGETSPELLALRDAAGTRRAGDPLSVAMNYGIAKDVVTVSPELEAAFTLGNRIAPVLADGLRGNPRQIKGFLNTLELRRRAAARRSIALQEDVLAKLMILERLHFPDFERVFLWQLAQNGRPRELAIAEATVRGAKAPKDASQEAKDFADSQRAWLELDPPLVDVDLGPYFSYARDRLSRSVPATRLPAELQDLLAGLGAGVAAARGKAISEARALAGAQLTMLFEALVEQARRDPDSGFLESARELAVARPELAAPFFAALRGIPPSDVPGSLVPKLALDFRDEAAFNGLLDTWAKEGPGPLKKAIAAVRKSS